MERTNLFYRRPELYDEVQADPGHSVARRCAAAIADHGPGRARTVLDLGCGTGRELEYLAQRFACVGVDVLPGMVGYGLRVRPHLDLRVGDLRVVRLGRRFDAVLCLGNTVAYLHAEAELAAAFGTFAAHARPGGVLVLVTATAAGARPAGTHRVDTATVRAEVTIVQDWDPGTRISVVRRSWRLDDGGTAEDVIRRRIWAADELRAMAAQAGFRVVEADCNRLVAVAAG
ncbi:MAG TPA: methyltransferase domain-containing protein [Pseudonocardiaceae bacterium]